MELVHIGKSIHPLAFNGAHGHNCWELIYNVKGTGIIFAGGNEYKFYPGSIVLLPPKTLHQKASETHFEDYYLQILGCDLLPQVYCLQDNQRQTLFQLIQVIYACFHETETTQVCRNLLSGLMDLVAIGLDENSHENRYVQCVRHAMISRFSDAEFRVHDAMDGIPLSKDYLCRLFKASIKVTPQEYLTQLRIENAKNLLAQAKDAEACVAEIAYLSGFYDPLYFSRVFKKHVGMSPSAFQHSDI